MTALSQVIDNEHMQRITSEFSRIGEKCYLENAGATLYPQCLLGPVNEDLMKNFYMNPHSDKYTRDCIEQIRCLILKHFNTDSSNYSVVFTSGCTQSLKLVVESFQFSVDEDDASNGSFVYLRDNHTSVLGLRELAIDKNADVIHISHDDFLTALNQEHVTPWKDKCKNDGNTLLVYPAQSNFNGYKYPIDCVNKIKEGCLNSYIKKQLSKINCNWYILLDAAAFVATNKLDLSKVQPDFLCLSFYKIFGFPTGLGALLIKNGSENVISQKKYFGGGTVDVVLSSEDFHVKRINIHERFEDGTVPFLSIIALKHCFDTMHMLIPKVILNDLMETISHHTYFLAKDLYHQLSELTHKNGSKAAILYMDSDFTDIKKQGGIVTFNLLREDGSYIGYAEFQHMADLFNISVRTGCFCNSGTCQRHLMVSNREMKEMYKAGHKCGDELDLINGKPTGAVRASFGYFNTFHDVDKFIIMICRCFVKAKVNRPRRSLVSNKAVEITKLKIPNGNFHKNGPIEIKRNLPNGTIHKNKAIEITKLNLPNGNVQVNKVIELAKLNIPNYGKDHLNKVVELTKLIVPMGNVHINKTIEGTKQNIPYGNVHINKTIEITNQNIPNGNAYKNNAIKITNGKVHKIINDQEYITNDSDLSSLDSEIELKEIAIFPIKSCGAFKIKSGWKIGPKGFFFDREWMIVKDNGVCLTQKQNTRMCMIHPRVDLKQKLLILTFKDKSPISIPLDPNSQNTLKESSICQSKICTDLVKGYDCGDAVADWISEALEVSFLRLIKQSSDDGRTQKKKNDIEHKLLSLSNQAQYLLINKATVRWLGSKIHDPMFTDDIDMLVDRFRGNLIIDMETELAERDWNKIIVGKHEFKVEGQCNRCQMVCIDQQTGQKTAEPLRTISEQFAGKLRFGIYLSYVGTVDGSKDRYLKTNTSIKPIINDEDLSR